jgi:hypothetical protein
VQQPARTDAVHSFLIFLELLKREPKRVTELFLAHPEHHSTHPQPAADVPVDRVRLGPWTDQLDELLLANEGKAAREHLTLIRLFEELRNRGDDGGYDAVRRYAGRWSKERGHSTAAAYVPLSFAPGEAYQFDWSHEIVLLNGVTVTVKAAHARLCHSRMLFVRAYPRETQEMVFDAHDRALLPKGYASTCPQLAKADAASPAHPLVYPPKLA